MAEYTLSQIFGLLSFTIVLLIVSTAVVYGYWTLIKLAITNIKEEPVYCIMLIVVLLMISFAMLSLLFGALGI